MGKENWNKHRLRWLNRIKKERRKAEALEDGIHYTLDQIELNDYGIKEVKSMLEKLLQDSKL